MNTKHEITVHSPQHCNETISEANAMHVFSHCNFKYKDMILLLYKSIVTSQAENVVQFLFFSHR